MVLKPGSGTARSRSRSAPRRKRKRRPPRPDTAWTIRYALGALMIVLAAGVVEALVVNVFIRAHAARLGLGGILLDCTMLSCLIPLYRRRPFRPRDLGLRSAAPAPSVGWVLLAVIVVAVTNEIWLQGVLGLPRTQTLGITLRGTATGLVLAGVFIAFLAPVSEEIFFRGLLYRALRNRLSVPAAAVIGGLVFALVHGLSYPLDTLPPRLVFGVIACLLYERTNSLLPGIALHILIDAGAYEVAVSGHNRFVFPGFTALGLLLLVYAGVTRVRRSRARSEPTPPGDPWPLRHPGNDSTLR